MAILDTNKTYIKLLFNECMIKGRSVYIRFITYATKADRDKEKARQEEIQTFLNTLRDKYRELQEDVQAFLDTISNIEHLTTTEQNSFNLTYEPKMQLARMYMAQEQIVIDCLSTHEGYNPEFKYIINKDTLTELGFKEEWVTDPVYYLGETTVYAGEFNGEEINEKFYYNRLKPLMSDTVINC